jgi:DNA-binding PadR family transcriptional regulator
MPDPVDDDRRELQDQIKDLIKKQNEDENRRKKELQDQVNEIMRKQKEDSDRRMIELREQIAGLRQQQREQEDKLRAGRRELFMGMIPRGRGGSGCNSRDNDSRFDALPDSGDVELRKGFLKLHILGVLNDGPTHGYEIMHRISHHTGHLWRPSPGSLYPALESLVEKGYIACQGDGRRKVYSLTQKGEDIMAQIQKRRLEQFQEMKAFLSNILGE